MKRLCFMFLCFFSLLLIVASCDDDKSEDDNTIVDATLTEDLQFLHEEEKLARDVYLKLYEEWNLVIHNNIASSEQTHMNSVKSLIASLGIEDSVKDETVGVFVDSELKDLFTSLVETGKESENAALRVGAIIEDLDIKDIQEMKSHTSNQTVLQVYDSLQCGSRNHLRSYTSALKSNGADYSPQFISQSDFDAIISSASETCGQ